MNTITEPQAIVMPELTYSRLIKGFEEWLKEHLQSVTETFTPEHQQTLSLEDFAVDQYELEEIGIPTLPQTTHENHTDGN